MLGAELAARHEGFGRPLLYRRTPDSYELVPDQRVVRLGRTTTINTLGVRGDAMPPRQAPATWRIMILGDSVANGGTQLDDAQTFAARTSRELASNGCKNDVLNASAGGWALSDEVSWLQRHGLYGAQSVVWVINYMDLDQSSSGPGIVDSNPAFPSHPPMFGLSEILFRYALPRLGITPPTADKGSVPDGTFDQRQFALNRIIVRAQAAGLARNHVPLIVLYHDSPQPMPPARVAAEQLFLADLASQGIAVVRSALNTGPGSARFYADEIHPNSAGAERIAHTLAISLHNRCPTGR
ncbi:hypothetical protein [Novosphingobium sp.]|uniref:hypothetical protein n=1 Tax=Novosphingobium sp. TaxID=1874826 RepID=UPI003B51E0ED